MMARVFCVLLAPREKAPCRIEYREHPCCRVPYLDIRIATAGVAQYLRGIWRHSNDLVSNAQEIAASDGDT